MIKDWKNKKVGILGFGLEGLSSARFLYNKGAEIWILDKKKSEDFAQDFLALGRKIAKGSVLGENYLENLGTYDVIVRSPDVKRNMKELIAAEKKGVEVSSHIKIFFDLCPAMIIGVTGTKGKGTTTTLIYEMLKRSERDAYLGGNIGIPPLDFLDKLTEQSVAVLELSSFQLEDLHKSPADVKALAGKPHIAVMLMVVPEHLARDKFGNQNYHETMEEYVEAKRNILRFQKTSDYAILNRDYIPTNESDIHTLGKVFFITRERTTTEQGTFVKNKAIWMRIQGTEWKIIDTDKIALIGKHNWENAGTAAMAATLGGANREDITSVLRMFKGLEHRLELVREVKGVKYYNDSFSTTPETVIAAIEAFTQPEILILGGSSKKSDFGELGKVIAKAKNIKAIIGVGKEWMRIKSVLKTKNLAQRTLLVEGARDMKTIVAAADKIARSGDVVLLSPGCASFGMFKNYKDRGEQFKREVEKLN